MSDHLHTLRELGGHLREYYKDSRNFRVDHRAHSILDLESQINRVDFVPWDRDGTLQGYHAIHIPQEHYNLLKRSNTPGDIISNSDLDKFQIIGRIWKGILPASKLVSFSEDKTPHLLRYENGKLEVWTYDPESHIAENSTDEFLDKNGGMRYPVLKKFKKPNPFVGEAVIAVNIAKERIPENPLVLGGGDRYFIDVVGWNLVRNGGFPAKIETFKIWPYKPFSDFHQIGLLIIRPFDSIIGRIISESKKVYR